MRIKPIFFLLVMIGHLASGQKLISRTEHVELYQQQSTDSLVTLNPSNMITAIAIKSEDEGVFKLVQGEGEQIIPRDPDVEDPTYFISLENPTQEVSLIVPLGIDFEIYLIASGEPPAFSPDRFRNSQSNECNDPPPAVPQSTWRSGLPEPNYTRSFHEVFHNVIHHSAGSNTNTNYTQVVRDIYLYHTEVNGWSDMGYNYLIAQDGTLYTGRDPGNGSQDNVRGAHFCGANSNTLGVCLLGNYETATVTTSTWETLESLLTFELLDQGRDPFDSYNHSLGNLGTIIGHRDGCATLCPGENVYNQLMSFKSSVDARMQQCIEPELLAVETDTTLVKVAETVVYQARGDYDEFEWVLPGALPRTWRGESVSATYAVPGNYDITLIARRGSIADTLALDKFMKVSLMENEPVVFPNPVVGQNEINIDFADEIVTTALYDFHGRLVGQWNSESILLNELRPGIYFLSITTSTQVFKEKLVIL